MTKGKGIGIFVAVIAVSIVVGIASLPDEVLLESPQLDASENLLSEMIPIVVEEEPIEVIEEEPIVVVEEEPIEVEEEPIVVEEEPIEVVEEEPIEVVEEEPIEVVEEEPESADESEGKVITVKINDGVGAKMR